MVNNNNTSFQVESSDSTKPKYLKHGIMAMLYPVYHITTCLFFMFYAIIRAEVQRGLLLQLIPVIRGMMEPTYRRYIARSTYIRLNSAI